MFFFADILTMECRQKARDDLARHAARTTLVALAHAAAPTSTGCVPVRCTYTYAVRTGTPAPARERTHQKRRPNLVADAQRDAAIYMATPPVPAPASIQSAARTTTSPSPFPCLARSIHFAAPSSMCKLAITTIPSLAWLRRAVRRRRRRSGGNHTTAASASCFSSFPSCPCPAAVVPAGHVAVCVEAAGSGSGSGSTRRFVVPLAHLSHPAFRELLQKAEDEYGFPAAPGPVALPCDEDHFLDVLRRVSSSPASSSSSSCGLPMRRCSPRGELRPLLQAGRIVAVDEKLVW